MGLFDSIGGIIGDVVTGLVNNDAATERQHDAQTFSAQQYATRFQTSVKDMEAAGLNPMLAYSQVGGSPPTSTAASSAGMPSLGNSFNQSRLATAQVANVEADTQNKAAQADLIEAQAAQARASAWQSQSQVGVNQKIVEDMTQKLQNGYWDSEVQRIQWAAKELWSKQQLNQTSIVTQQDQQDQLRAQIQKLDAETGLLHNQQAAEAALNNLGRTATQFKPVIDAFRSILMMRGGK